ncbi:hypothetical protein [Streptomyces sp. S.PB5]|uniref:hypothetical protein n=1 Tax=Streptomyces sp. S.PB5 TaxID=3020844 RepID=UPI0025AED4A9|nr:hypothetical protein [Streptomyces sp. S.PB5]MDN3020620.1 hypothetical protein [Streptomyces sp. S.PB5]
METTEILVVSIGSEPGEGEGTSEVEGEGRWPVVARLAPSITIYRADAKHLPELSTHGRLAIARSPQGEITSSGDYTLLRQLDATAGLFVEAWKAAGPRKQSSRPGDGRNWGDPEFQPPDQNPNGV